MRRIVITGGPCTGKTTIIHQLQKLGHEVFHEAARKIIRQELQKQSNAVPWDNVETFSQLVLAQQVIDFNDMKTNLAFYDRGIPDLVGYMNHANLAPFNELQTATKTHAYNSVFICPPWQEIYTTDTERKESYPQAELIHKKLNIAYQNSGYKTIIVPKKDMLSRIDFILNHLDI